MKDMQHEDLRPKPAAPLPPPKVEVVVHNNIQIPEQKPPEQRVILLDRSSDSGGQGGRDNGGGCQMQRVPVIEVNFTVPNSGLWGRDYYKVKVCGNANVRQGNRTVIEGGCGEKVQIDWGGRDYSPQGVTVQGVPRDQQNGDHRYLTFGDGTNVVIELVRDAPPRRW